MLSAYGDHACALDVQGELRCWGDDYSGESSPPAGSFVDVAAGSAHACALDDEAALVCWGSNSNGQANPPD